MNVIDGILQELPNDVRFIDPSTGEIECTFNSCINKFKAVRLTKVRGKGTKAFTAMAEEFVCETCGRRVRDATMQNRMMAFKRQKKGKNK